MIRHIREWLSDPWNQRKANEYALALAFAIATGFAIYVILTCPKQEKTMELLTLVPLTEHLVTILTVVACIPIAFTLLYALFIYAANN